VTNAKEVCAITGASGYVGSILAEGLCKDFSVVAMLRKPQKECELLWSLQSDRDIAGELRERGVKTLVHAAWDMQESDRRKVEETCVNGSARLFEMAAQAGVERIVFLSTISAFEGCRSVYGNAKLSVEKQLCKLDVKGVVIRPGLVFGAATGGVFGGIRKQVRSSRILPMIGSGNAPQYLLHEHTLVDAVVRAVKGEFDSEQAAPITVAHPQPWRFRDLVHGIAATEGRKVVLIPLPAAALYGALRAGELLGARLPFRSDSVVSFMHYNKHPDFTAMTRLQITPLPFLR
jgi:nucleoside-diphosphate-sugar epimerase